MSRAWNIDVDMFRLGKGSVECDEAGVRISGVQLLNRRVVGKTTRWEEPSSELLDQRLSEAYGLQIAAEGKRRGFGAVADALNAGEIARAQIVTLHL